MRTNTEKALYRHLAPVRALKMAIEEIVHYEDIPEISETLAYLEGKVKVLEKRLQEDFPCQTLRDRTSLANAESFRKTSTSALFGRGPL